MNVFWLWTIYIQFMNLDLINILGVHISNKWNNWRESICFFTEIFVKITCRNHKKVVHSRGFFVIDHHDKHWKIMKLMNCNAQIIIFKLSMYHVVFIVLRRTLFSISIWPMFYILFGICRNNGNKLFSMNEKYSVFMSSFFWEIRRYLMCLFFYTGLICISLILL